MNCQSVGCKREAEYVVTTNLNVAGNGKDHNCDVFLCEKHYLQCFYKPSILKDEILKYARLAPRY